MKKVIIAGLIVISLAFLVIVYLPSAPSENAEPTVSKFDLLHTLDVMDAAVKSVEQQDPDIIKTKIEHVVKVADEIGLAKDDIAYLESEQALDYLRFHAKRKLFDAAVVKSYRNLTSIVPYKELYPEANDRFSKADAIIEQRNQLFEELVNTLKAEGMEQTQAEQRAKALWLERFALADLDNIMQ